MNFRSYGILRKSTMFGNRIFANNKVLIRQWGIGAIYDIDTGTELNRLLGNTKSRFFTRLFLSLKHLKIFN